MGFKKLLFCNEREREKISSVTLASFPFAAHCMSKVKTKGSCAFEVRRVAVKCTGSRAGQFRSPLCYQLAV